MKANVTRTVEIGTKRPTDWPPELPDLLLVQTEYSGHIWAYWISHVEGSDSFEVFGLKPKKDGTPSKVPKDSSFCLVSANPAVADLIEEAFDV